MGRLSGQFKAGRPASSRDREGFRSFAPKVGYNKPAAFTFSCHCLAFAEIVAILRILRFSQKVTGST
jgi:hypothetical protein